MNSTKDGGAFRSCFNFNRLLVWTIFFFLLGASVFSPVLSVYATDSARSAAKLGVGLMWAGAGALVASAVLYALREKAIDSRSFKKGHDLKIKQSVAINVVAIIFLSSRLFVENGNDFVIVDIVVLSVLSVMVFEKIWYASCLLAVYSLVAAVLVSMSDFKTAGFLWSIVFLAAGEMVVAQRMVVRAKEMDRNPELRQKFFSQSTVASSGKESRSYMPMEMEWLLSLWNRWDWWVRSFIIALFVLFILSMVSQPD